MLGAPREGSRLEAWHWASGCPPCEARVWGEVVRGRAKTVMICSWLLACTACGAIAPANLGSSRPGDAPTVAAIAPGGACAAVKVTTPIAQVSPACQQRWSPYWV